MLTLQQKLNSQKPPELHIPVSMKTLFPLPEYHEPKRYIIDVAGKTLGRVATKVSKLLRGKESTFFTPGVNQGNYVVILNADKIKVTGEKENQKLYYRNSTRPGGLKVETFKQLQNRIPTRIIEQAVWGMLPKGVLGRSYYRNLYVYSDNKLTFVSDKKKKVSHEVSELGSWILVDI